MKSAILMMMAALSGLFAFPAMTTADELTASDTYVAYQPPKSVEPAVKQGGATHGVVRGSANLLRGSANLLRGSANLLRGSANLLRGSANLLRGSANLLRGPDNLLRGPDNLLRGPDNLLRGPDNLLRGPDNLLRGAGHDMAQERAPAKNEFSIGNKAQEIEKILNKLGIEPMPESTSLPNVLATLAPGHVSYTDKPLPSLYWYLSYEKEDQCYPGEVVFTLNTGKYMEKVIEKKWNPPSGDCWQAGLHKVDLSDHNVMLQPGADYEWFVLIVTDPRQRAADKLASGTIRFKPPEAALRARLNQAGTDTRYRLYAKHGYWYDALHELNQLLAQNPHQEKLQEQRAQWLIQEEMCAVAGALQIPAKK